jgi:hypothetical protein
MADRGEAALVIPGRASSRKPGISMWRARRVQPLDSGFAPEEGAPRNDQDRMRRRSRLQRRPGERRDP